MNVAMKAITNGVDIKRLVQTIEDVKAQPELAKFNFRIENRWIGCGENRSEVKGFSGCKQEWQHAQPFVLTADEADILLGQDRGANPVEYLLHALASCVTTSMIYHAAARGIQIEAVESALEGDLDLRGFLGLDPSVRNGYNQIRMTMKIKADATDQQLTELGRLGPTFSPVFDSITRGVPVTVTAQRMQ
jgi:uncharacterized OsmC-like protein